MQSHNVHNHDRRTERLEAGEIDRGEKGLHDSRRKSIRKKRMGIKKKVAKVQEKRKQERELIQP